MNRAALLLVFLLVSMSGSAAAFTFGPMTGNFAETRSGQVRWATNVTIEADALVIRETAIQLDAQRIDIQPDGLQKVQVYITRYTRDYQTLRVVMAEGANTGLNLTYTNSGNDLRVYQNGVNTHTCAAVISPCSWIFSNDTSFNFSILTPIGVQQAAAEGSSTPAPADLGGGGGGSPAPPAANPRATNPLAQLPDLPDLFPRLSVFQWAFVIIGGVLVFNGMARTRAFLPPFLRIPWFLQYQLFAGVVILVLVYLTPIPEPASVGSATP